LRLRGRERLVGAVGQEPAQLANVVLGPPDARPHLFDRGGGHTIRFVGREATLFYRRFIHNPPTRRECVEFPTFPNKGVMLHPRLIGANWSMSLNVVWARAPWRSGRFQVKAPSPSARRRRALARLRARAP